MDLEKEIVSLDNETPRLELDQEVKSTALNEDVPSNSDSKIISDKSKQVQEVLESEMDEDQMKKDESNVNSVRKSLRKRKVVDIATRHLEIGFGKGKKKSADKEISGSFPSRKLGSRRDSSTSTGKSKGKVVSFFTRVIVPRFQKICSENPGLSFNDAIFSLKTFRSIGKAKINEIQMGILRNEYDSLHNDENYPQRNQVLLPSNAVNDSEWPLKSKTFLNDYSTVGGEDFHNSLKHETVRISQEEYNFVLNIMIYFASKHRENSRITSLSLMKMFYQDEMHKPEIRMQRLRELLLKLFPKNNIKVEEERQSDATHTDDDLSKENEKSFVTEVIRRAKVKLRSSKSPTHIPFVEGKSTGANLNNGTDKTNDLVHQFVGKVIVRLIEEDSKHENQFDDVVIIEKAPNNVQTPKMLEAISHLTPSLLHQAWSVQFPQVSMEEDPFRKSIKSWKSKLRTAIKKGMKAEDVEQILENDHSRNEKLKSAAKSIPSHHSVVISMGTKKSRSRSASVVSDNPIKRDEHDVVNNVNEGNSEETEGYTTLSIVDLRCMFVDDQWCIPAFLAGTDNMPESNGATMSRTHSNNNISSSALSVVSS